MEDQLYKIEIAAGLITRYGQPVHAETTARALRFLEEELERLFKGCTVFNTTGRWGDREEPSILFMTNTVTFDEAIHYPALYQASQRVAEILEQEAVMLAAYRVQGRVEFVKPLLPAVATAAAA